MWCDGCRTWAPPNHRASPEHLANLQRGPSIPPQLFTGAGLADPDGRSETWPGWQLPAGASFIAQFDWCIPVGYPPADADAAWFIPKDYALNFGACYPAHSPAFLMETEKARTLHAAVVAVATVPPTRDALTTRRPSPQKLN